MRHQSLGILPAIVFFLAAVYLGHPSLWGQSQTAKTIRIHAVGDIVPGTDFPYNKLPPGKTDIFAGIRGVLKKADIVFGNFEAAMTTYPKTAKNTKRKLVFAFRTPPRYAFVLRKAGFNVLNVANNHSMDFYPQGFQDTFRHLGKAGIACFGKKNQILYQDFRGLRISFIGFSYLRYHNSVHDLKKARALIQKADQNSDIVVISIHAGAEGPRAQRISNKTEMFYGENRGNLIRFAHTAIDAGADLVLGHGPHVLRAMEVYRNKLIAYSLGNFLGYRVFSLRGQGGISVILRATLNARGDFLHGKLYSVVLKKGGLPFLDPQQQGARVVKKLSRLDIPHSPLYIDDIGNMQVADYPKKD